LVNPELNLSDLKNIEGAALSFATKIESLMFAANEEKISKEYGVRYRELYTGLKSHENT